MDDKGLFPVFDCVILFLTFLLKLTVTTIKMDLSIIAYGLTVSVTVTVYLYITAISF